MALNFDNPFLELEFPPPTPWVGVRRVDAEPDVVRRGASSADEIKARFRASVARCIGDAEAVAVMYSGGLDSASVLVHAAAVCEAEGRRLVAVVWNFRDQLGVPAGQLAHRQLRTLGLNCDLIVLEPDWKGLAEPEWSSGSPRLDYYTRLHAAMVARLTDQGAEVLLTGVGGDEVLGAWQYLSPGLLRARRWRGLRGYAGGLVMGDSWLHLATDLLSPAFEALPLDLSFALYLGFSTGTAMRRLSPGILQPPFAESVAREASQWRANRLERFRTMGQTWAEASLYDSVFPLAHAAHPHGVGLDELSPFLDVEFRTYALELPLIDRFDYGQGPPYHWYKALHFRLLPLAFRAVAPTYKQSYSHVFRDYHLDTIPTGDLLCVELGLLRPEPLREVNRLHPRMPAVVRNVENWVRGAVERGAVAC